MVFQGKGREIHTKFFEKPVYRLSNASVSVEDEESYINNEDGDLEIGSSDTFGFGSGEDRLKDALEDSFDEIASLFTHETQGVAVNLYDFVEQYTSYSGLIK